MGRRIWTVGGLGNTVETGGVRMRMWNGDGLGWE